MYVDSILISKTHERTISRSTKETANVSQRVSVIFPLRNHGTWLPPSPEREEPRSKLNVIRHSCISTNNTHM
ncbi:hypothetical protein ALC60_09725 [Trachymyrmex zeteki]|uniref:Uncharacterized protein n=1 Tax=Mycetomoellerius zeteki TaxID=64791 RepID=A0A151WTM9_9HYME|nr:hypothetical protein ALC60_09725 [Trachymyrmex zeteki]